MGCEGCEWEKPPTQALHVSGALKKSSPIWKPITVAHFAEAVNESGTESVPGIDRRTRTRLSFVWRADIRDPVPVSYQADALGSHDQRFLRAPGPQHRLRRVLSEESTLPASTIPGSVEELWSGT